MSPTFFLLIGVALVLDALYWHLRFLRAVRRQQVPPPPAPRYPSVSVIRPVRGRDVDAEANFAAALDTGYPGEVETIFVVDEPEEPALELLEAAVAAHRASGRPGKASIVIGGHPPAHRTGKLNAMMAGMRVAHGELVAFGDSDSRPDRDVLRVLVDTLLATPKAGCAFAPVVVPRPAQTAGDLGYALMLNGLYGPAVALAARRTGDLPFIMGQLMLFKREALAAAGGLASAEGHLVDDMRIGACLASAGWRNIPSSHPLPIMNGGMSLASFIVLMRRWLFFQRAGLSLSFTWPLWMRGIVFGGGLALGIAALAAGHLAASAIGFLATLTVAWSMATLHQEFGGAPVALRHAWMPLALFLIAPFAQMGVLLRPAVRWRGRDYSLDRNARLDTRDAVAAEQAEGPAFDGSGVDDESLDDLPMGPAHAHVHAQGGPAGGSRRPILH